MDPSKAAVISTHKHYTPGRWPGYVFVFVPAVAAIKLQHQVKEQDLWTDWAQWWGNTPDRSERRASQVSQCHQARTQKFLSILISCHEMNSKGGECMYHYCNCNHILYCSFIFRIITLFLTVTLNMAFLSHINYICVLITFNFLGFGQFYGAVSTEGDTREILCKGSIQFSYFHSVLKLIIFRQNIQ